MKNHLPHVLLVNSADSDRLLLGDALAQVKARVTAVGSGLEAIEILHSTVVDLVITDIDIGEFDCWRLTRIIRSGIYRCEKTVPIIVVTRNWCERITEITVRDFDINHLLPFDDRARLPELVTISLRSSSAGLNLPRVLVVEDHAENARLVSKVLQHRFEVELAADGAQGLALWKQERHDLVLLDLMLPGMSGEEVLEEILQLQPLQPVVVMTAHGTTDLAEKLMIRGAVDFITKPFRPEQLRKVCDLAARREDYLVSNAQFSGRLADLQQLRQLLSNIIDSMPSVLIGVDREGRVTQWNHEAEAVVGQSAAAVLGQPLEEVCGDLVDMAFVRQAMQESRVLAQSKVPQRRAAKTRYIDLTIYPLQADAVGGAVIRIDDVTQRTMLERRMVHSEKMASLGELVAGMAHEINNPLAGILQNIQVVRNRFDPHLPKNQATAESVGIGMRGLSDYLDQRGIFFLLGAIMDSGMRAAQLVENMLKFSQQGDVRRSSNNLAQLLDGSVELAASHFSLRRKFDFRLIQIQREYADEQPLVDCDGGQIQQVLINLLMNGAQAMEEKYKQQPAASEDYLPEFVLRLSFPEGFARIEVEDNGPGITAEMQERIFEPFFTSKTIGDGTGLGLSICYFIVTENHKGTMSVESTAGGGTRFIVALPRERTDQNSTSHDLTIFN